MEEVNIKDYFSYLKHYIFAFIIAIMIAVSGVLVYDIVIKKPVYTAKTTVVIANSEEGKSTATTLNDVNMSQKLTTTYSEIAKSDLVLNDVINTLGIDMDVKALSKNVTVKPVDDTSIMSISVKDLDPAQAARITNTIANVFSSKITEIFKLDNVSQLSVAEKPTAPSNNTTVRDAILATAVAILVVAGFAFLKFYLDDTVKHTDDIEKNLGLPVAGSVLKGSSKKKKTQNELIVERLPKAVVSENIKSLRTNLQFTSIDSRLETILVTSTNASEGKSFISSNLAVSFAQADKKVLLVDCDLRKGRLHRIFGITNTAGLSDLLAGDLRGLSKYVRNTGIKNLDLITCGTYPPNPSELLASQKNKRLIRLLKDRYDIVIFDGAPIGGLADSVILSSLVNETLIVVREGATAKSDLAFVKDSLDKVGAKIAGVVFNMVNQKSSKYYSDYYSNESGK